MTCRTLSITLSAWLASFAPMYAAGGGEHHGLTLNAPKLSESLPINNSMVLTWVAVLIIVAFCQMATRKMAMIPSGLQNLAECAVETLYDFLGNLLGDHLVKRVFWFLGSIFFFILVNNYMGLLPGVGTIGRDITYSNGHQEFIPYLRGGNADINLTAAMALTFAILWFYWAITENGIKGFLAHIFAPKGSFKGFMLVAMVPVFLFVGVLEVISICIRPIALSFRLFGNIYGGEQTLESLMALVPEKIAFLPALPFYFVELLVGFVQALVFTLLCAIFLKLICDHGEEHH